MEWFYFENDVEKGPVSEADLKEAYKSKKVHEDSFLWNQSLPDWVQLKTLPDVLARLQPSRPPTRSVAGGKGRGGIPSPAEEKKDVKSPKAEPAGKVSRPAQVSQFGAKKVPKWMAADEKKVEPSERSTAWSELLSPEGLVYYYNDSTDETSWEKPDELKSPSEFERDGEWVWAPNEADAFVPARIIQKLSKGAVELELENGQRFTLKKATDLIPLRWSSLSRNYDDLVMLDDLNQPLILHTLRQRFSKCKIYTSVGTILISVNPYQGLPLYSPKIMDSYRNRGTKELPPHVFMIADNAYEKLIELQLDQSVIISGESGAGKTEATKQCLQYLADCAGSESSVEQKILSANPILEAFGNAKTVRNNNSSRFGKYIEVFFDESYRISGAQNTNYLLEKVRVVHQAGVERNYHIFFQLCAGCSPEQVHRWGLGNPRDFYYLSQSESISIPGVDDGKDFQEVIDAFRSLGVDEKEVDGLFSTTVGVLHLGNIDFIDTGDRSSAIDEKCTESLEYVSRTLSVPKPKLIQALTKKVFTVRGETTLIGMSAQEARDNRDALAKYVYDKQFDWLVGRINVAFALGKGAKRMKSVGVLDIFGFEIFQVNSFEQLCINYTNEKLQQHFNSQTFKLEEQLYRSEQIVFDAIQYIDNQPVLDLIESRPSGILRMLDEELKFPKASDKTFVDRLHQTHRANALYAEVRRAASNFIVKHYAGDVEYDSTGFLEKNRDSLSADFIELLSASANIIVQSVIRGEAGSRKTSLAFQFSEQLERLMVTLNTTEPHYIRCIKPNHNKSPKEFFGPMILEQLTNSGVFEAVKIRKSGFPFRYTHEQFVKRYRAINPYLDYQGFRDGCSKFIQEMKLNPDVIQIGKSRVLYRATEHRMMELRRNIAVERIVMFIQRNWRGSLIRKMRKQYEAVKPTLLQLIRKRNLEELDAFLISCQKIKFPFYDLEQGKLLRVRLQKERELELRLERLYPKDAEDNFEEFSQAVAAANELELKCDISNKVKSKLLSVQERRAALSDMKEGTEKADRSLLERGLANAKRLDMVKKYKDVVSGAEAMLDRILREEPIVQLLTQETSRNCYAGEGSSAPAYNTLFDAVRKADAFVLKTKEGQRMHRLAEILLSVRQFLAMAVGTKDRGLWNPIEALVISAQEEFGTHPEIRAVKEAVAKLAAKEEIAARLQAGIDNRDQDELQYGLDGAAGLQMRPEDFPVVADAQEWLASILACRGYIKEGVSNVDEETLVYALEYANSINFNSEEIKDARNLCEKIIRLNRGAEEQNEVLEPDMMKAIVEEAQSIRLSSPDIQRLYDLLYNTSEETFLDLQLQAAVKLGDLARVTRVTIKSKDVFFSKMGNSFEFSKFPGLLSPKEYAEAKYFGLHFKKEKLAAGFLKHDTNPIHIALIRDLNAQDNKDARRLFKTIMCYMGDRQNATEPFILVQEMLTELIANSGLRSESYCQLVKQLSDNPSSQSTEHGWNLLSIFLDTFPCSNDLENYLEYWIRSHSPIKELHVKMFHQTVYGGAKKTPLTYDEMNQIINQHKSSRDFDDLKAYEPPKSKAHKPPSGLQAPNPWQKVLDEESGEYFYYNSKTQQTTWDPPPGFK